LTPGTATDCITLKVNVSTYDEFCGLETDWAEVVITRELAVRIRDLHKAVKAVDAKAIEVWDYSPEFHLDEDPTLECEILVVTASSFHWRACHKHGRGVHVETDSFPVESLDDLEAWGHLHDNRHYKIEDEEDGEVEA